jgi:hypothetical protein
VLLAIMVASDLEIEPRLEGFTDALLYKRVAHRDFASPRF